MVFNVPVNVPMNGISSNEWYLNTQPLLNAINGKILVLAKNANMLNLAVEEGSKIYFSKPHTDT